MDGGEARTVRGSRTPWHWVVLGGALVLLGAGAGVWSVRADPPPRDCPDCGDEVDRLADDARCCTPEPASRRPLARYEPRPPDQKPKCNFRCWGCGRQWSFHEDDCAKATGLGRWIRGWLR
jgi:hypothetical protein